MVIISAYVEAPWGGYKQERNRLELGTWGYEAFTEVKQVNLNKEVKPIRWFSNPAK